jgi:hypothetical protein
VGQVGGPFIFSLLKLFGRLRELLQLFQDLGLDDQEQRVLFMHQLLLEVQRFVGQSQLFTPHMALYEYKQGQFLQVRGKLEKVSITSVVEVVYVLHTKVLKRLQVVLLEK